MSTVFAFPAVFSRVVASAFVQFLACLLKSTWHQINCFEQCHHCILLPCPASPALCVQCLWFSTEPAASSFLQAYHVVRHSRVLVLSQDSQVLPAPLLSLLDPGAQLPLVLPLDCWPLWPPPDQPWQQTWRTARPCSRAIAPPAMLVATTASWPRRS